MMGPDYLLTLVFAADGQEVRVLLEPEEADVFERDVHAARQELDFQ